MKIAIDCRMLGKSGIGVYLENILFYLLRDKKNKFLLLGNPECLDKYLNYANCTIYSYKYPIFSLVDIYKFPYEYVNTYDLYYSPNFNVPFKLKIPVFTTIHDVVFLDIPIFTTLQKFVRFIFLKRAVYKSDIIFTVSDFSKQRIVKKLKADISRIKITYNGLSQDIIHNKTYIYRTFNFSYYLYVGNIKPHKGLKTLLQAYELAIRKGCQKKLIIIGEYNNFKTKDKYIYDQINYYYKENNIIFTGHIDSEILYEVIYNAFALIQPSLYEGFGLPPLEAIYLGTPAIISDIPVFKEIYKDSPVTFFKTNSVEDLCAKMLNCTGQRVILPNNVLAKYSYKITAQKILNEIKTFLNK